MDLSSRAEVRGTGTVWLDGCCVVTDKVSRRLKELKFTFTFFPPMLKGSRSQTLGS